MKASEVERRGYSLMEVAKLYGFSLGFVRKAVRQGRLRVRRVGRRLIVLEPDLATWLDAGLETKDG